MRTSFSFHARTAVALLCALTLVACGGGSSSSGGGLNENPGEGDITLVSFSPDPILGCAPVPFVITGTNFETVSGTTAKVTWRALGGATPFAHGTSATTFITADVTSDTTIEGLTPHATICGVASIVCEIDVELESGESATSTGVFTITLLAPTITSIAPDPFPAAIATPFTITGTGFGPNGPVVVRFAADGGELLFADGTQDYFDVVGTITSPTTIVGTTPVATVCGPLSLTANLQLFFPDGCCSLPTAPGFTTFLSPTVTLAAPNPLAAAIPTTLTITGTNFGPTGQIAMVRFVADGGAAMFSDGTANQIDVVGLISSPTTVTLTSPLAAVCGVPSLSAAIRVTAPYGSSCFETAPGFVTFLAPTLVLVAPNPVAGAIATPITLTGTNFGPVGQNVTIRYTADGGATPFADGTSNEIYLVGTITSPTTVATTTPLATVCDVASVGASIRVLAPAGGACVDAGPTFLVFDPPALASISPVAGPSAIPTAFTITGAGFGPVGSEVVVRFLADGGATPFGNGDQNTVDVPGVVASATTITGTTPLAAVCGVPSVGAAVRVILQNGSCQQTAAAFYTFNAPTLASVTPNPVFAAIPTAVGIVGTGFGPVGGLAQVYLVGDGGVAIFADGTQNQSAMLLGTIVSSTTIAIVTPHATVAGAASRTASAYVVLPNGSCVTSGAALLTFVGPTVASMTSPLASSIPTAFTITGTGFGPVGSEAIVRFLADAGTPFADGTNGSFDVPGTVTSSTTITGTSPLAALCAVPSVNLGAAVKVTLQDGSTVQSAASFTTFTAPTATTIAAAAVPASTPTSVTISGTGFGPVGGTAVVVLLGDAGATIFADGTSNASAPLLGSIASSTTVVVTTPRATVAGASATASAHVTLPSGACAQTGAAALTFLAPTLASIATGPFPSARPTAFTITGANFGPVGSEAIVRFTADGGATPFANATSNTFEVPGVVTASTTITGTTPLAALCPAVSLGAAVRVQLQDGSSVSSAATFLTFLAPSITTFGPNPIPAGAPSAFTVTGSGFGPDGSYADVRFTATSGTPFAGGTLAEVTVTGTVAAGGGSVTGTTPVASLCGASSVTATVVVTLQGGSCASTAAGAVTFNAPTISGGGFSPAVVPGAIPTAFTITGTGFGPVGGTADVTFSTAGATPPTPFGNGSLQQVTVQGTITSATTIAGTTPLAAVCDVASIAADVKVKLPDGACSATSVSAVTFSAPTLTSVTPSSTVDGAVATAVTVNGTGFGPTGATVVLRFTGDLAGTPIFSGGTAQSIDVQFTVGSSTTLTGSTPIATVCGAASRTASVRLVALPNGSCASSAAAFFTFSGPTIASVTGSPVVGTTPTALTVNGANYGPNGTQVDVRFTAASGTPFEGGTTATHSVTGTVGGGGTTIALTSPVATLCDVASVGSTLLLTFPNGSCVTSAANAVTFNGPTIASIGTPSVSGLAPGAFTLTGTNFPAVGTNVTLRFRSTSGGPPAIFADGTATSYDLAATVATSTTITGDLPLATLCGIASATASLQAIFPDGSCATSGASLLTYNAPQIATPAATGFTPQTLASAVPTAFTITGSGGVNSFGPAGATVQVKFSVASGSPFQGGTATFDVVPGLVVDATTIVGSAPAIDIGSASTIDPVTVEVSYEDGTCTDSTTTTYVAGGFVGEQQAYLKASNTGGGDQFGISVAVSGDTLVVGADFEDSNATGVDGDGTDDSLSRAGAAYVFVRSGTTWTQQAYLKASNTDAIDYFGHSVAVSADTIVVGAYQEDSNATGVNGDGTDNSAGDSGAAYVFVRSGTTWTQQAYLKASNTGAGDRFGVSVAVSGDTVVVGAYTEASNATGVDGDGTDNSAGNAGAAYVFVRSGTTWTQQAYLKASNTGSGDQFAWSVAASGDTVVVGANQEDSNATGVDGDETDNSAGGSGAAYVFVRSGTTWTQQAYLKASNTETDDFFGHSVAASGDSVVVGAAGEDSNATGVDGDGTDNSASGSGAAYVFVRSGTTWTQQAYLKASNTGATDIFGYSVAASADTVVVGASQEDSNATGVDGDETDNSAGDSGAAYVFVRSGTTWTQQAYVKASNTGSSDQFGISVAVSGGTVAVGAFAEASNATGVNGDGTDNSASTSGAAYVFR